MGHPYCWQGWLLVKTTVDIPDPLFEAARQAARRDRTTMRALIEQGLRLALEERRAARRFQLRDASVAGRGLQPSAEGLDWARMRALAYGDHEDTP